MVRIYFIMEKELLHATLPKNFAERSCRFSDALSYRWCFGKVRETAYFRRDYWMPVVKSIFEENGTFSAKNASCSGRMPI